MEHFKYFPYNVFAVLYHILCTSAFYCIVSLWKKVYTVSHLTNTSQYEEIMSILC